MKVCQNCGIEINENASFCPGCGTNTQETAPVTVEKKNSKKKIIISVISVFIVVGIVAGIISIFAFCNKKYEKVAKKYMEALLTFDIAEMHKTTIFNEEEYDKALIQVNEKLSNVGELYSYLSNEYYSWDTETNNYNDFYVAFTTEERYRLNYDEKEKNKIIEMDSTEMTEEELEDTKNSIKSLETIYSVDYPLPEEALIDVDKITNGFYVNVTTTTNVEGEKEGTYDLKLLKYNGDWFVLDNMCLMVCLDDEFESIPILKKRIEDSVLREALFSLNYSAGPFSIKIGKVISKCVTDYKIEYFRYEDVKTEYLSSSSIEKMEEKYNLDNAYFAVVTGRCMKNPDIPYLLSDEQVILNRLIAFDENDEPDTYFSISTCDDFDICALILTTS
ncbi:MAG: zinc ribbon domain-containing protein [Candidatus Fimenecus sp.]